MLGMGRLRVYWTSSCYQCTLCIQDSTHYTDLTELVDPVALLVQSTGCRNCIVWGKFDELAEAVQSRLTGIRPEIGYVVMNETIEVREKGKKVGWYALQLGPLMARASVLLEQAFRQENILLLTLGVHSFDRPEGKGGMNRCDHGMPE